MQLTDNESTIKDVYLEGIDRDVKAVQGAFRDAFDRRLCPLGRAAVERIDLPKHVQMMNMTFTLDGFDPCQASKKKEDVIQAVHSACKAIFVENAAAHGMMSAMGFTATRISNQKMRNSVMVEMDKGKSKHDKTCFLVRVWTNGKFAIMKGANTVKELFMCAKLISVLTHVGMGGCPNQTCLTPLRTCNVYLVNVPMRVIMSDSENGINIICLQRIIATTTNRHGNNIRIGFSVGKNARSSLQQQGNFEVSFVDNKITLKVFISSSGNMRIYLATGKPIEVFKKAAECVADLMAPIMHRCISCRKRWKMVSNTEEIEKKKKRPRKQEEERDVFSEEVMRILGPEICALGIGVSPRSKKVQVKKEEEEEIDIVELNRFLGFPNWKPT